MNSEQAEMEYEQFLEREAERAKEITKEPVEPDEA